MAEKEHPAALAGRYLRAAGNAIQKELDRRAAESEEAKAAEANAAQTARAAEPPEAPAQAAQPQAVPPRAAEAQATQSAETGAPPPASARRAKRVTPPLEPKPFLDRILWIWFMVALLALALSGLQIQMVFNGSAQTVVRLVLGVPLVIVAILVLTNWQRSNERLVARAFKAWGLDAPTTKTGRVIRRIAKDSMTLLGIVLLCVAAFQLLSAAVN